VISFFFSHRAFKSFEGEGFFSGAKVIRKMSQLVMGKQLRSISWITQIHIMCQNDHNTQKNKEKHKNKSKCAGCEKYSALQSELTYTKSFKN
jgi:hypothetical protein